MSTETPASTTGTLTAVQVEAEKFHAETERTARMFDALDHWRFIGEQPGLTPGERKVIRELVAEVRTAGDHVDPRAPGHYGGTCTHHWGSRKRTASSNGGSDATS